MRTQCYASLISHPVQARGLRKLASNDKHSHSSAVYMRRPEGLLYYDTLHILPLLTTMSNNHIPRTENLIESTINDISKTYLQKYASNNTIASELAHRKLELDALSHLRESYAVVTCTSEEARKIDWFLANFRGTHINLYNRFVEECQLRLQLEEQYARSLPLTERASHYITQIYDVQARNQQLALMLLNMQNKKPDIWETQRR